MYKIRFRKAIVAIVFDEETAKSICLLGTHFASFEVGRLTDKIRADVDNVFEYKRIGKPGKYLQP